MKVLNKRTANVAIDSIKPHPKNVNIGDLEAIKKSIKEFGFYGFVTVQSSTNLIIAGKHRWLVAKEEGATEIPALFVDVNEKQALKIMLADNRTARLGFDDTEALISLLEEILEESEGLDGTGYTIDDLDLLYNDLEQITGSGKSESNDGIDDIGNIEDILMSNNKKTDNKPDINNKKTSQEIENKQVTTEKNIISNSIEKKERNREDVPLRAEDDSTYSDSLNKMASSNFEVDPDWGIPILDINYQGLSLSKPIETWGIKSRLKQMNGTYHFYTDDFRYTHLYKEPEPLLNSGCSAIIEPNFGIMNLLPKVVVLYRIYQKRWMCKNFQKYGINIIVNLDMPNDFLELNFIGVPKGWKSYCTRGALDKLELLEKQYEAALKHSESNSISFSVFGGGKKVAEFCNTRNWNWIPDEADINSQQKFQNILKPKKK